MPIHSILLTDQAASLNLDSHTIRPGDFDLGAGGWSVRKRTLRGGLSEGVEVVEIDNGALSFTILPTRGMGLWRGRYKNLDLGWQSPVRGPVHPKYVDLSFRGGLGWLTGFDEWLCRCGLAWNGPPGDDAGFPLTLHGRIANQPAYRLEVRLDPHRRTIAVSGEVEEGGLFYPHLQLRTTYTTLLGSNLVEVNDVVRNCSSRPLPMQLLYHLNFGPPFLEAGSRVHVPVAELWPNTPWAAEGVADWQTYGPPTSGFEEQVYLMRPRAAADGSTLALLHDAAASKGVVVRWNTATLPCFTVWKNTAALEDGYVTGLEPATGFPRFRAEERAAGRVRTLAPGDHSEAVWAIEVLDLPDRVSAAVEEIKTLQSTGPATVHREPMP